MSAAHRYAAFCSSPESPTYIIKQRQIAVSCSAIIYYPSFTITLDSCQSDNPSERICAVAFISAFVFPSFDQNKHLRYGRFGALYCWCQITAILVCRILVKIDHLIIVLNKNNSKIPPPTILIHNI